MLVQEYKPCIFALYREERERVAGGTGDPPPIKSGRRLPPPPPRQAAVLSYPHPQRGRHQPMDHKMLF